MSLFWSGNEFAYQFVKKDGCSDAPSAVPSRSSAAAAFPGATAEHATRDADALRWFAMISAPSAAVDGLRRQQLLGLTHPFLSVTLHAFCVKRIARRTARRGEPTCLSIRLSRKERHSVNHDAHVVLGAALAARFFVDAPRRTLALETTRESRHDRERAVPWRHRRALVSGGTGGSTEHDLRAARPPPSDRPRRWTARATTIVPICGDADQVFVNFPLVDEGGSSEDGALAWRVVPALPPVHRRRLAAHPGVEFRRNSLPPDAVSFVPEDPYRFPSRSVGSRSQGKELWTATTRQPSSDVVIMDRTSHACAARPASSRTPAIGRASPDVATGRARSATRSTEHHQRPRHPAARRGLGCRLRVADAGRGDEVSNTPRSTGTITITDTDSFVSHQRLRHLENLNERDRRPVVPALPHRALASNARDCALDQSRRSTSIGTQIGFDPRAVRPATLTPVGKRCSPRTTRRVEVGCYPSLSLMFAIKTSEKVRFVGSSETCSDRRHPARRMQRAPTSHARPVGRREAIYSAVKGRP